MEHGQGCVVRDEKKVGTPKLHAIQLVAVQPMVLFIDVKADPSELQNFDGIVHLESAHLPYDDNDKTIQVRVRALIPEESELPISLRVEVVGAFQVDDSRFDIKYINDWAEINAPMVLYPFLREQVFGLTSRVGVQGLIIPLIEVPTFKLIDPRVTQTTP